MSDVENLDKLLTHPSFEVVQNIEEADVLWLNTNLEHLKDSKEK